MVTLGEQHGMQADIMFVIEGTATNGAYLNDLKTNYLIPTLEYFSQGNIEDRDYVCESTSTLYGLVVYHAADIMPRASSDCYGPYSSPQRFLATLDKLELIGGKGESHGNIAEGLATALQAFEDLQLKREGTNILTQKHCLLVCNSPPYMMPVMESSTYLGHTTEQLAALLNERNVNLSILSPRKIPALFKLFEKAGGDLTQCQNKNYAKDPRHLVMLRGFSLKERPLSPTPSLPIPSLPSPISNVGSPAQPPGYRPPQTPQSIAPPPSPQQSQQNTPISGRPFPGGGPPGYPGAGMRPQGPRWPMAPPPLQQQRTGFMGPAGQTQGSALIAQLTQPPSAQFPPHRLEGPQLNQQINPMQQQQQQAQQQQQMRMAGMGMSGQPGMGMIGQNMPMGQQQPINQQNVMGIMQQQPQNNQQPGNQTPGPGPQNQINPGGPSNQQLQQSPQQGQQPGQTPSGQQQQQQQASQQQTAPGAQPGIRERHTIWAGVLEWNEKGKPNDTQKVTKQVPCQVSSSPKEGEPDLKADSWPQKLIMQLMPKQLIGNIGGAYLKNSTSVLFHPQPCEALDSLTRVMSSGFAGCVHFTSLPSQSACDIKVLILLYTMEKRAYLGFIPNDQVAFVDRLRKVIQAQKNSQALIRQNQLEQVPTSQAGQGMGTPPISTDGSSIQSGVILSQTNTMTMGGGQISQFSGDSQPADGGMGGMNQSSGSSGPGRGSPMMGVPARPYVHMDSARQHNLQKIQQLQQTLEQHVVQQQQEMQYKSQLEILNQMKIQQLQQNLEQAQQQEINFQAQLEPHFSFQDQKNQIRVQIQQMQQRQMNPQQMQQQQQQQQSQQAQGVQQGQQRMVRPPIGPNPGLRHLLQQQQTPYRQQMMGMNQMRPNQPNQQQQQFDDVSNFDFMN